MRKLNLIITFSIIFIIFGSFFALAAELDLKITAKLNGFDTDFYAQTDPDSAVNFDSYDFEQRSFPSGNYSFLLSNIGTKNLTIDSWSKTDRTLYLVYRINPNSTGTLNLTWNSSVFGAGTETFDAILADYGNDSTYNSSNIVSTINMEQNSSYEANITNSTYRYLTMTVDYIAPSGPSEPEEECQPDCSCASDTCTGITCSDGCDGDCSGTKQPDCSGRTCGTSPNGCGSCGPTCQLNYVCSNQGQCEKEKCSFANPCEDEECIDNRCENNTCVPYQLFSSCDDNNKCTLNDQCSEGSCQAGARKECPIGQTCNPETGNCEEGKIIPIDELPEDIQETLRNLGCTNSRIICGEYSACEGQYDANMLITESSVIGLQTRICIDKKECVPSFTQTQNCSLKQEVTVETKIWCGEEYTEIKDATTGKVLSRLKQTSGGKSVSIDISAAGEGYCYYCYDGIKNYDEEGLDCGGSCSSCETRTVEYPAPVYNMINLLLSTGAFLFFLICFILVSADLYLFIKDIFLLRRLGGKYEYWNKKGYDVEAIDNNLHKMEKAYEYKLKHHHHKT